MRDPSDSNVRAVSLNACASPQKDRTLASPAAVSLARPGPMQPCVLGPTRPCVPGPIQPCVPGPTRPSVRPQAMVQRSVSHCADVLVFTMDLLIGTTTVHASNPPLGCAAESPRTRPDLAFWTRPEVAFGTRPDVALDSPASRMLSLGAIAGCECWMSFMRPHTPPMSAGSWHLLVAGLVAYVTFEGDVQVPPLGLNGRPIRRTVLRKRTAENGLTAYATDR